MRLVGKNVLIITGYLALDVVFINMAFYSAYLIRFRGAIDPVAFKPYLYLWPHISIAYVTVFLICGLYEPPGKDYKRSIFNACTISALASISIVYAMRHFWGFIPSSIFLLAAFLNIILIGGWRIYVRYSS